MKKIKKLSAADDVQEAAMGHNQANDEMIRHSVDKIAKWMNSIEGIRSHIKEEKQQLKDAGVSKIAITGALQDLRMTEEQRQASEEVKQQRRMIYDLCADMPLFSAVEEAA